ncbi:hypothetical protein [Undibacterium sp. TS12]|uniref:hypothetical protein n=1 Tax=Undibacterium sp. TS12 TaxID=2908202 RepID=UPI001F4C8294|nr:hypothetical protein [Undibacterium sp. TS12]MCH8619592.1 hypothetical protein [Undibacterium sp. TS12]
MADVHFHEDGWECCDNAQNNQSWYTETRDPVRIQLFGPPASWSFDLRDEKAAHAFFYAQSQSFGGALLDIAVETIAGVECLVGVFKYKSPIPDHSGMYYVGIVWLPFEKFLFQVNFESLEQGTTRRA